METSEAGAQKASRSMVQGKLGEWKGLSWQVLRGQVKDFGL